MPMKTLRYLGIFLVALFMGVPAYLIHEFNTRAERFLEHAFVQLDGGKGDEPTETIRLDSGDSFSVILEHSC